MARGNPILWKLLVRPGRALRDATADKPVILGLLVFILALASKLAALVLTGGAASIGAGGGHALGLHLIALGFGLFCWILLWVAAIHLAADLTGGAGRGLALLTCFMLALLPVALVAPLALVIHRLATWPPHRTVLIAALVPGLWAMWLQILSVREVYRFGWIRAFLIYGLTGCFLLAAFALGLEGLITGWTYFLSGLGVLVG